MQTAKATHVAAPFRVLVTNEGAHPATEWAKVTSEMLVQPRADALPDARAEIHNLQYRIQEILFAVFNEVGAATSPLEALMVASQAARRISDIASDTRWAHTFAAPPVQSAIEELICRNLASASEIAAKME